MKEQNLLAEDWDTLIILDACRYDFFEKVYQDYLGGKLDKRRSLGSCTGEWLVKSFPGKYDITYVSANPYINSYGLSLKRCNKKYDYSWKASEHFAKIIDVWNFGWDENLGTVPPKCVNEAYFSNQPDNRTIVHYIQPHPPYLSLDFTIGSWREIKNGIDIINETKEEGQNKTLLSSFRKWLNLSLEGVLGKKGIWRIRKLLGKQPESVVEWLWREGDIARIYYYYEDNLRQALKATMDLVENLEGKIVVTADHGEAFGEQGVWGHPQKARIPVLVEVPWLEVKKRK